MNILYKITFIRYINLLFIYFKNKLSKKLKKYNELSTGLVSQARLNIL